MEGVGGEETARDLVRSIGGRHGGEESSQSTVPALSEVAATTEVEPSVALTVGNWGTLAMVVGGFTEVLQLGAEIR